MKLQKYIKIIKQNDKHIRSYFVLATLRILLVFVPQFGYIHPDEFFQSVEVMAGDEYGLEHTRTWEFNSSFPIRSIAIPYTCIKIPLNFLKLFSMYVRYFFQIDLRTGYVLLVFPRLIMALLSFSNDWALYQICRSHGLQFEIRLIALASSFVMLVFGSRTFSNTIEMCLCSVLLYIVTECMVHSNTVIFQKEFLQEKYDKAETTVEKVRYYKIKASLPKHSLNKCFIIATICVMGVFNRPTFLIFGMPIVFFWLIRGIGTKSTTFFDFNLRISCLTLSALPALLAFIVIDSLYYGYLTYAELHDLQITINNFVVTPLNFIRYNINPDNTGQHGIHPKYLHLFVNIPLLYNILGLVAICSFFSMIYRFCQADYKNLPRAQSIITLMNAAIFLPVALLSLINHQEARFLLPITLPIILLHAPKLHYGFATTNPFPDYNNRWTNFIYKNILRKEASAGHILRYWYAINIAMTFFFGFLHQGGVFQMATHISGTIQHVRDHNTHTHLVTSHIYSVPMSFFFLPSTQTLLTNSETGQKYRRTKQLFLYEYGDLDIDELYKKLKLILDINEMKLSTKKQKYHLFLVIPTSLSEQLSLAFWRSNSTAMRHERIKVFYPHLSTEAFPTLYIKHPSEVKTDVFDVEQKCSYFEQSEMSDSSITTALLKQFSSVIHQFGLALYRINVGRKQNFI